MANIGKKNRIGVIGLGGMGKRWIQVIHGNKQSILVAVCDANAKKTRAIARKYAVYAEYDWKTLVVRPNIDVVVIATPHTFLTKIAIAALRAGKHVFCEKPGGISSREVGMAVNLAMKKNLRYRVNFNMRLHPAVALAKKKADDGIIGKLIFLRGVYGHGGREHFDKEWWCKPEISGGGEWIDQGSHLVDLANWFLGPFSEVSVFFETAFWKIKPVEDNAFALLKNKSGAVASLHASWTHWKKMFRIELFGTEGYFIMEGLGGQYGLERLIYGKRIFGRRAPPEHVWEFPSIHGKPDVALKDSWKDFVLSIREQKDRSPSGRDAYAVLKIIEKGYIH